MSHLILDVTSYTPANGYNMYDAISHYSPPHPYTICPDEPREPAASTLTDLIKNYVYNLANTLSRGKTHRVDSSFDELYGVVVKVTTDLTAREALEFWLKLVEGLTREKYKIAIAVEWIGENNVSQDELIDYIVRIMIKSGVGPIALPGFEAITAVREARRE